MWRDKFDAEDYRIAAVFTMAARAIVEVDDATAEDAGRRFQSRFRQIVRDARLRQVGPKSHHEDVIEMAETLDVKINEARQRIMETKDSSQVEIPVDETDAVFIALLARTFMAMFDAQFHKDLCQNWFVARETLLPVHCAKANLPSEGVVRVSVLNQLLTAAVMREAGLEKL